MPSVKYFIRWEDKHPKLVAINNWANPLWLKGLTYEQACSSISDYYQRKADEWKSKYA